MSSIVGFILTLKGQAFSSILCNYRKDSLDPRNDNWLGRASPRSEISNSGLWNINHVGEQYDTAFLDRLADAVEETASL